MELGGAESALIGMLQSFDVNKVDVDLFIYDHRGDFFPLIPTEKVNLLPQIEVYSMLERPLKEVLKNGFYSLALMRLLGKLDAKFTAGNELVIQPKWASKILPPIANKECIYDLAISFLTPHYFVLDKVNARKKVGWIHTDYTKIPVDAKREVKMWERLDQIVSISLDVTKSFLQVFPTLKNKIILIENILSPEFVKQRAKEFKPNLFHLNSKPSDLNLLSIGRICPQKNFDNIPFIAKKMKEMGVKFHWYIIGPGEHNDIDETILKTRTGDVITFLGPKSNPYPYIKACDVYLQPSRYEGKSVTVREAQILCKPVVVTNYATAPSQIQDGVDGVIVPMDNENCARGMVAFLNDRAKQEQIIEYLRKNDYGNENEIEKIYNLIR